MKARYDYIIVGAGLCGLVLAKELVKKDKKVLILEKGDFLNKLGTILRAFFFYDKHALSYSRQGIIIYRVKGVGGTSVVGLGNAVTPSNEEIRRTGIDFSAEIPEAKKESYVREKGLTIAAASLRIMQEAGRLGYDFVPMPKFNISGKCICCGNCYLGCDYGSKWTSRHCLKDMDPAKYELITGFNVEQAISENNKAVGVSGKSKCKVMNFFAEKIIICAGGIGTPIILQNSGVKAGDNFFADLFNVTYGLSQEYHQRRELTMPVVCSQFHASNGFVLAPFVDNWYSFFSSVEPRHLINGFRLKNLMGIMVKINDDASGRVNPDGTVDKGLTGLDEKKLRTGSDIAREILIKCGCKSKSIFVTRPNGAHPGGTAAIGRVVDRDLQTRMKNLYVCDNSVFPFAPGLPPTLMLIALCKWLAKRI